MVKAFFNWSGGKDSALALFKTLEENTHEVNSLFTSINQELNRISMHGVRKSMLIKQTQSIGLPLTLLELSNDVDMASYDYQMKQVMDSFLDQGYMVSVFGDIFLEDLRSYRDKKLAQVGLKGHYPLWKRNTTELIHEFIDLGFKTIIVAVNTSHLDKEFVGEELTLDLIREFPSKVDPCGENGEYHTFVYDGPIFNKPIKFNKGEIVQKVYPLSKETTDIVTYCFQDLY